MTGVILININLIKERLLKNAWYGPEKNGIETPYK